MNIKKYWETVLKQDADALRGYFNPDAYINWHCTNEHFTVEEFIRANCEYPGEWDGEIEKIESFDNKTITVTHVYTKDKTISFHVTSFIALQNDKIISVDEYWADDGDAPFWRQEKHIGTKIHS